MTEGHRAQSDLEIALRDWDIQAKERIDAWSMKEIRDWLKDEYGITRVPTKLFSSAMHMIGWHQKSIGGRRRWQHKFYRPNIKPLDLG